MIYRYINLYGIRISLFVLSFVVTAVPALVTAAPLPAMNEEVSLVARETNATEFLEELFGLANIPVVVDGQVNGTVNGFFSDTASVLHDRTMKTLKLMTYFDGQVAHVYNANDLKQEVLPVSSSVARKIINHINLLQLTDKSNTVAAGNAGGLVVKGAPRFVEQVKEASTSIRRNTKKYVPLVVEKLFYLKHAWVQDTTLEMGEQSMMVPGIVSILNELISKEPMGVRSSIVPDSNIGGVTRLSSTGAMGNADSNSNDVTKPVPQPRVGSSDTDDNDATRVVAVPRLNAVLVRDLESRMGNYASLIEALDVEPYMLEIEATIIDINSDRSKEFGVNWRYQRGDGNEALVGNGTITDQLLNPGTQITPQGQGGILSLALGNPASQFLARISALESKGEAEIVSKPHVVTLSNVEAVLDTTQSFFVRVEASDDAALFKITAGTTLRVTPHVYRMDGTTRIKLMVNIQDGATSDAEVDQIPVIGNSNIRTQAIITDGDSLLVGGLVRESKRNGVSKVPFLGDIPGLGSIFRTNTTSGNKVERLFLITPRLAFKNGFNKGKRMDAPVLQGAPSDIIGTAGNRIAPTIEAIHNTTTLQQEGAMVVSPSQSPQAPGQSPAPVKPVPTPAPAEPVMPQMPPDELIAQPDTDINQPSKEQILQSVLVIPPAPATATTDTTTSVVDAAAQIKTPSRWTVEALPAPSATQVLLQQQPVREETPAEKSLVPAATDPAVTLASRRKEQKKSRVNDSDEMLWQEIKPQHNSKQKKN